VGYFTTGEAANGSANGHAQAPVGPGELPDRDPDRMWGGPSPGGPCAVCRTLLRLGELEIELEFYRNGDSSDADRYHVHVRCLSAWHAQKDGHT